MEAAQLLIGFLLGAGVAWLAWRARALTPGGALAAALIGGLIFGLGGLSWAALLLAFFLASSGLSFAFRSRKLGVGEKFAKGSRRDWAQVLANGGAGALLVVIQAWLPGETWPWIAYAGSLAAVNADTWSTELGVLSPSPPRRLAIGPRVEAGTSGGMTLMGTLASLAGAAWIGALTAGLTPGRPLAATFGLVTLAGMAGALLDSALGGSVQGIYFCPACEKETERHPQHSCGTSTRHVRGWRWLTNDLVNLAAALCGAVVAALALPA